MELLFLLASFDLDVSSMLTYAEDIFNGLMPAFVPVLGIVFGISLVILVIGVISKAVKGAKAYLVSWAVPICLVAVGRHVGTAHGDPAFR